MLLFVPLMMKDGVTQSILLVHRDHLDSDAFDVVDDEGSAKIRGHIPRIAFGDGKNYKQNEILVLAAANSLQVLVGEARGVLFHEYRRVRYGQGDIAVREALEPLYRVIVLSGDRPLLMRLESGNSLRETDDILVVDRKLPKSCCFNF